MQVGNSRRRFGKWWALIAAVALVMGAVAPAAGADGDDDGSTSDFPRLVLPSRSDSLAAHDAATAGVVSSEPSAMNVHNIDLRGRGNRISEGSTTDVWALGNYAYTGTFSSPCGGAPDAGIFIWDVKNPNKTSQAGFIASPTGSRSNDVKVASMNSGDILVHSNEPCAGGPGGFEIFNVDDPESPVHLASVTINESDLNIISPLFFAPGALDDVGVHNLFLFTQGNQDYVAAVGEGVFDNFRIYEITTPGTPTLVSGWGAEELVPGLPEGIDDYSDLTLGDDPTGAITLNALNDLFVGFGASQNKFLHDITISADGNQAYLANWDAGLVLLDISDVTDPQLVSVAIDVANGSLDGEVNSHSVWPSEDGSIVVEGEEDFAPFGTVFTIDTGPAADTYSAAEGAITVSVFTLPGGTMTGVTTYVGLACTSGSVPAGSGIALIQRGACAFTDKINNAESAGYDGVVVFNDAARGDALVTMGGSAVNLPGVFVGHSTGLAIAGVASAGDLVIGASGESVSASAVPNAWSGLRIWDYSDPANPVLASLFDTTCSADPVDPICDPAGTYSVHNVIVETKGNKVMAYVSWYSDGMLVIDVTDPENPVEVGRFLDSSTNGGFANDFWGVYKIPNDPFFFGSDRNGGLYTFKQQGSGSG